MTFKTMVGELAYAFINTFLIFAFTLLGALPLGLIVYFCKKSRFLPLRWITEVYISVMRGTPLILQIMVIYYVPSLVFDITFPGNWRFYAVVVAFIVNYAAYFAEIYRGGIESIEIGQYEAAQVLGYGKLQTFVKIILPQMVKRTLPAVTNEVITLVKDTSLASAIGTIEMFTKAKQIAVSPRSPGMMTFLVAGVFYYVFNAIVAFVMKRIEKALNYYQ
ncbi:MAG: amino acid ABC transporter permease [Clostridia bacterium]|nr:amino acid ABC transporter permease [Clostridia bacterium]